MRSRPFVAALASGVIVLAVSAGSLVADAQVGPSQVPTVPTFPGETTTTSSTTTTTRPATTTTTRPATTTTTSPGPIGVTLPGGGGGSGGGSGQPSTTTTSSTTTTTTPPGPAGPLVSVPGAPAPAPASPAPAPAPGPGGSPSSAAPAQPLPPGATPVEPGGEGADTSAAISMIPPDWQRIIDSVVRTRANNTGKLLDALRQLEDCGLSAQEAAAVGMGHFPIAGYAGWSDDWLYFRAGPPPHLHQGNDIFAAEGTPIRAPFDGVMRYSRNRLGGLAVYLTMADGTYFYNAHLSAPVLGLADNTPVKQGTIIGFVGRTGNAATTPPHNHFEVHPRGGPAVNPKPYLDAWVAEAIAQVPSLLQRYCTSQPKVLIATGLTRRLSTGSFSTVAGPSHPPRGQLLWASSMNPSGGTLQLAAVEASRAAATIDWRQRARRETAKALDWDIAREAVDALLDPVTPPALVEALE